MNGKELFNSQTFREQADRSLLGVKRTPEEENLALSLLQTCESYLPLNDVIQITEAADLLILSIEGQKREGGPPASTHSLEIAHILADARLDKETIITGLVHDLVEDTKGNPSERIITNDHLRTLFGDAIADMVEDLTKVKGRNNQDLTPQTHLKIFESLLHDPRAIFVKLADRLHNMRTIEGLKDVEKRRRKARETLLVYAPLARQLGMEEWAQELADLSFKTLYPKSYKRLKERYQAILPDNARLNLQEAFDSLLQIDSKAAESDGFNPIHSITIKSPSFYHLYQENDSSFADIFDRQLAYIVSVVVKEKDMVSLSEEARETMKTIYWEADVQRYFHLIERIISDFPTGSREKLAQALQDGRTIYLKNISQGRDLSRIPFSIRFIHEEDYFRQNASLFDLYSKKETNPLFKAYAQEKLDKLKRNIQRAQLAGSIRGTVEAIVEDLDIELINVISEKGETITMPAGTVLDGAYAFRTDVGDTAVGAEITRDGATNDISDLSMLVQEGDKVVIKRDPEGKKMVQVNWLDIVKTAYAKGKIKSKLRAMVDTEENLPQDKQERTDEVIKRGVQETEALFARYADRMGAVSNRLLVGIDHTKNIWAHHHNRRKPIPGDLEHDSLRDFLIHVGLEELNMKNYGRRILIDTTLNLLEFQQSLVPIHLIVANIPGVSGKIGRTLANAEINIVGGELVPYQYKEGLQRITYLVTKKDRQKFIKEGVDRRLRRLKTKGRRLVEAVHIHASAEEAEADKIERGLIFEDR